ncbi:hypothetical protein LLI816_12245 (plasmid) [Lactococcus lactis subsp. lactis]|uniref:hypothetical protein n=2 Tax=Lactobacillales TaxID=186826 RepID=UPI001C00E742|nr:MULTISPECIES: hypothetical protein [Enterococcus]MBT9718246.1 hypothetical protein [Enterococcus durans]MCD5250430.1 hypothetical protein [Enterococcus faecalis]HAP4936466.1 hypothetical protein [Enterococcus faecalis]
MRESKPKKCMMPNCDKETFDKKAFFCREHTRVFESFMSTTKKVAVPVAASAALFVAKVIGGKKK